MKKPSAPARGTTTGRPIMVLLDVLGQRWTLRILWELRHEPMTFRELQAKCEQVSPTVLNRRLKELRELKLIEHDGEGYRFTESGHELAEYLLSLHDYAERWAISLGGSSGN